MEFKPTVDFKAGDILVISNTNKTRTGVYVKQPELNYIVVELDEDVGPDYPQQQHIGLFNNTITNITATINELDNI